MRHDLGSCLVRLDDQLGIALANAELLESKSSDDAVRVRARHVVDGVVAAMTAARQLRSLLVDMMGEQALRPANLDGPSRL